jgi:hypothetical protein
MSEETDYKRHSLELGKIAMWLEDFDKADSDSTYLCFLRFLADYRHLQAQALDNAVEREEERNENHL